MAAMITIATGRPGTQPNDANPSLNTDVAPIVISPRRIYLRARDVVFAEREYPSTCLVQTTRKLYDRIDSRFHGPRDPLVRVFAGTV